TITSPTITGSGGGSTPGFEAGLQLCAARRGLVPGALRPAALDPAPLRRVGGRLVLRARRRALLRPRSAAPLAGLPAVYRSRQAAGRARRRCGLRPSSRLDRLQQPRGAAAHGPGP